MSYYIKEKRTRSPRGMGYLSTHIMPDNSIFKLPPPPLLGPSMHSTNLDFVNKAIEMAKSEHAQHQKLQQQQQHQHSQQHNQHMLAGLSPPDLRMCANPAKPMLPAPPPLTSGINGISHSGKNPLLPSSMANSLTTTPTSSSNSATGQTKSPSHTPSSTPSGNNGGSAMLASPGTGNPPHPSFFMNGHPLPPLMFGEMPPHLRNAAHPQHPALFPGMPPFPPHSSAGFPGNPGMSPLHGLSPNLPANLPSMPHQNLPPHLQMFGNFPHLPPSPLPLNQQTPPQPSIKKEPLAPPQQQSQHLHANQHSTQQQQQKHQQLHSQQQHLQLQKAQEPSFTNHQQSLTPLSAKSPHSRPDGQPDEAIDLRKKTPPPSPHSGKDQHGHSNGICHDKENCCHASKLKYLRLNVVRMLGILVPNLNFAEKGISAESESVDELLQDVIESNAPEEEILE